LWELRVTEVVDGSSGDGDAGVGDVDDSDGVERERERTRRCPHDSKTKEYRAKRSLSAGEKKRSEEKGDGQD